MSLEEDKRRMIAVKESETALEDLNSTSRVSVWLKLLYIVAFCLQHLREYFKAHRNEVDYKLANLRWGTLPWYRQKALAFQYGFDLVADTDVFVNGIQQQQIEESKIIKYAAVNDGDKPGVLIVKVAGENKGVLAPILPEAKLALENYFNEIKGAGHRITVINYLAEKLLLNIDIYYDALVLTSHGVSILNGNKPVEDAVNEFMKELPFNGELILQDLIDRIQKAEGVEIVHLKSVKSSWIDPVKDSYGTPSEIEVKRIPESGYFLVDNFKGISYVV